MTAVLDVLVAAGARVRGLEEAAAAGDVERLADARDAARGPHPRARDGRRPRAPRRHRRRCSRPARRSTPPTPSSAARRSRVATENGRRASIAHLERGATPPEGGPSALTAPGAWSTRPHARRPRALLPAELPLELLPTRRSGAQQLGRERREAVAELVGRQLVGVVVVAQPEARAVQRVELEAVDAEAERELGDDRRVVARRVIGDDGREAELAASSRARARSARGRCRGGGSRGARRRARSRRCGRRAARRGRRRRRARRRARASGRRAARRRAQPPGARPALAARRRARSTSRAGSPRARRRPPRPPSSRGSSATVSMR